MKILLGISGAIATLDISSYIVWLMRDLSVEINVVMTPTATRFVSPQALGALVGTKVHVSSWESSSVATPASKIVAGVKAMVIAPASTTTIARCATGNAETLLSACYLAFKGPCALAPSM